MTVTGRQFEITSGQQWAAVTEVGANLRGYRVGGIDVTHVNDPGTIAPKSSGAVLMPWPNRIRNGRYRFDGQDQQLALSDPVLGNASHGLSCWSRWAVTDHRADRITLSLDVVPQKGWPGELRVGITYGLDPAGLTVTLRAENIGAMALPFGAGSHPYLSIGDVALDEVELQLEATERLLVDERQIPTGAVRVAGTEFDLSESRSLGTRRMDTAFRGLAAIDGRGAAHLRAGERRTTLWWEAPTFSTVQVFTPPAVVDRPAIAIEPMTCPPDAFNSGQDLLTLSPGESWSGSWGITAT